MSACFILNWNSSRPKFVFSYLKKNIKTGSKTSKRPGNEYKEDKPKKCVDWISRCHDECTNMMISDQQYDIWFISEKEQRASLFLKI